MNSAQKSNPKIRALARKAAQKIKALRTANEAQIAEIYQNFRTQADQIKAHEQSGGVEPGSSVPGDG